MSIGAKAGVNIETCSMMYETFATVAAEMIGGARAEVKSAGKAVLEGRAKFEVTSSGEGEIKAPLLKIHSPLATIEGGKLTVKSALIQENGALFKKGVSMLDNLKVKGYTHLNGGLAVKKGANDRWWGDSQQDVPGQGRLQAQSRAEGFRRSGDRLMSSWE